MMKKLLLSLGLITIPMSIFGMDKITLADAETLNKRLNKDFAYFNEKTNMGKNLANKNIHPRYVVIAVENAICDFHIAHIKEPALVGSVAIKRTEIIKLILQGNPQALDYLQSKEYLS